MKVSATARASAGEASAGSASKRAAKSSYPALDALPELVGEGPDAQEPGHVRELVGPVAVVPA